MKMTEFTRVYLTIQERCCKKVRISSKKRSCNRKLKDNKMIGLSTLETTSFVTALTICGLFFIFHA